MIAMEAQRDAHHHQHTAPIVLSLVSNLLPPTFSRTNAALLDGDGTSSHGLFIAFELINGYGTTSDNSNRNNNNNFTMLIVARSAVTL